MLFNTYFQKYGCVVVPRKVQSAHNAGTAGVQPGQFPPGGALIDPAGPRADNEGGFFPKIANTRPHFFHYRRLPVKSQPLKKIWQKDTKFGCVFQI